MVAMHRMLQFGQLTDFAVVTGWTISLSDFVEPSFATLQLDGYMLTSTTAYAVHRGRSSAPVLNSAPSIGWAGGLSAETDGVITRCIAHERTRLLAHA